MKLKFNYFFAFIVMLISSFIISCTPKVGEKATEVAKDTVEDNSMVGVEASQPDWADKKVPLDESVRTGTLANGMKYYIQRNVKPEGRAELRLAIDAGAMQEDEDQQGLAHFLEHMCFNGTKNFKKSELVDYLESIGTKFGPDLNAYTSFDETVYMLQVRTDDQEMFDKGLLILEDWAGAVTFEMEEIDKERGVILGEWRSRLGAGERMQNQYFPVLFKDSRYAKRLPIGQPEIIKTAPREAFTRFYNDWYRPDLMAVVVVGDIDVDAVEKQVKENFATLKNPENSREKKEYDVPKHDETLVSIVTDKEASSTQVQVMYKHDPAKVNNLADYRMQMVHSLYNDMLSARLDELTRTANPPFLGAFAGYGGFIRSSDFYYSMASVKPEGVLSGLEAVLIENQRVLQHGFNRSELDRTKKELMRRIEKRFKEADKTPSGRLAMRYVSNHLEDTPYPSPQQTYDLYKQFLPTITVKEVNALAAKWITDKNRVVIVTGPDKEGVTMPTEKEIRQVLDDVKMVKVEAYEDNVSSEPLLAAKLPPTPITSTSTIDEIGVTELVLANGIKVILKPTDFKNDEILMSSYSPGGHSLVPDEDFWSAALASTIINQSGVGKFDATELQKMLAGKTVNVGPFIDELDEGMNGNCSPKDFETMLQLVYLYFTEPRRDETAMSSFMTQIKTQFAMMGANPQFFFAEQVSKELYGDNPRKQLPTLDGLDKVTLDKVMEIYKQRFANAGDFIFTFTGNFDPEAIKGKISQYLGNLPATPRTEKWKDVDIWMKKGKISKTYEKGQAPKSVVQLMFEGEFDWDDAQARYDFKSMIAVMRIKLREKLREDEGGVYGVRVSGNPQRWPKEKYSISIEFNANPDEVEKLVKATKEVILGVINDGVEDKDITKVTETQKQERIKQLKENRFWNSFLLGAYINDLDPKRVQLEHYEKAINGLNSEAVQKMAKKVFNFSEIKEFILMPEKKEEGKE